VSARILVVLGGLMVLGVFMTDLYLPALPDIADGLGGSDSAVQVTLTGCLIGLGLGQLTVGTLSDTFGRRGPLLLGLVVFAASSLACAIAPSLLVLDIARVVQGVAGGAGMVLARAIVSDESAGLDAGRAYAVLGALTGVGPILAPTLGAALLVITDWRGVFVALAIATAPVFLAATVWVPPMPAHHRRAGGARATLHAFRTLLRDWGFLGYAVASGFAGGTLFAYISGSSFVLQDVFGLSPQLYAVVFAGNGAGFLVTALISGRVLPRFGHERLLAAGLIGQAGSSAALLGVILLDVGLGAVLVCLFVAMAAVGLIMPNSTALALAGRGALTGAASALFGMFGFSFGAIVAPVVGVAGTSAVPMAIVMAALSAGGLLTFTRRRAPAPSVSAGA
jgi:DHA1 family bicyclomycin/chloramphenicol resistance-like MFS transporter